MPPRVFLSYSHESPLHTEAVLALAQELRGAGIDAATTADGRDRKQLERICRYLLRPPFAHDAVTALPGDRVRVSFKAPWRSGTAHADMDAHQFLARLCALVPPPGFLDRGLPAARRAAPHSPSRSNSSFKTLKRRWRRCLTFGIIAPPPDAHFLLMAKRSAEQDQPWTDRGGPAPCPRSDPARR
ncbi:MAG: transposase [Nannocystis sp.]|nr:transposase [Nannocystis sp.]